MSIVKSGLLYSTDHEWVRPEGGFAYVGITDYAQNSLGDLVFADAEPEGSGIAEGDALGVVESVKAAADVTSPVDCEIAGINSELLDSPERINAEPYESWLVKVRLSDPAALDGLMDAEAYQSYLDELN